MSDDSLGSLRAYLGSLRAYLWTQPIVDEERDMWLQAGFYVAKEELTSGRTAYVLTTARKQKEVLTDSVGLDLRRTVIELWNARKTRDKKLVKPLTEDEEFKATVEARNQE